MIYLIRHPQSLANVQGINGPLDGEITERGKWQINKTVKRMANENVERIISSPALRCLYLAQEIANQHKLDLEVSNDFRERDYGILTGKSGDEIFAFGFKDKPEGGESTIDVFRRAGEAYNDLDLDKNTLIVSHGLFLKMFTAHMINMNMAYAAKTLKFSNCGISQFMPNLVEYMNDRTHLGKEIKKIHIFGGWASGKTTLADKMGIRWDFPVYHLDELKYGDGFKERSVKERIALLEDITSQDCWITEGAWTSYAVSSFEKADFLIYQDIPKEIALARAEKREKSREKILELSHEQLIGEIIKYYDVSQGVSKNTHDNYFKNKLYNSVRFSNMNFQKLLFPEDLWDLI